MTPGSHKKIKWLKKVTLISMNACCQIVHISRFHGCRLVIRVSCTWHCHGYLVSNCVINVACFTLSWLLGTKLPSQLCIFHQVPKWVTNSTYATLPWLPGIKLRHELGIFHIAIVIQRNSIEKCTELVLRKLQVKATLHSSPKLLLTNIIQTQTVDLAVSQSRDCTCNIML